MINAVGKLSGRITERKHIQGAIYGGTIEIYPELEDLEVTPSAEEQHFKSDKYGYNNVLINAVKIKEHYLQGTNLILVLPDSSKLTLDISLYIDGGLTQERIEAINNMIVYIDDENLFIDYDENVLDLNFSIQENNLAIENNIYGVDFNINNGELEVSY